MNTKTTTPTLKLYLSLIALLFSLSISSANAQDCGYMQPGNMGTGNMGMMGMGNMGPGNMGMGNMGPGNMGMGNMGPGMMGMGNMGAGNMGMMRNSYMHMLDLTTSQRKSIRDIQKATRTQQFTMHDKLTEYADDLSSLYNEDKPNAKKIGSIYKKIFDLKRQKIELGINTKNKAYDVLTKEQKEKLKEWKSSRMGFGRSQNPQGRGMGRMMQ